MLLILCFILGAFAIGAFSWWICEDKEPDDRLKTAKDNTIGFLIVFTIATIVLISGSYGTMLSMRKSLATIEQYKESIELYAEKGVEKFRPSNALPLTQEMTDLKYNNYQAQMGQMIMDMRDTVVKYNKDYASKKAMKDNLFFNWIIVLPDDMKPIKMSDYIR